MGEPVTASFAIANSGNAPAGPFDVQWTPYALATPLTQDVSGLGPGDSTTVTITFTFPFTGTVTGKAVLIDATTTWRRATRRHSRRWWSPTCPIWR